MSDLLLGNNQIEESYKLLKRILFVFECSIHPKFNLSDNTNRIIYKEDNIFFFNTLFKYLQSVWRRGYCKSALNISSLLLSLDPENDPMGVIHIIDYLCIGSGNYSFLINFYESNLRIKDIDINYYPNILYGYAISLFNIDNPKCHEILEKSINYYPQAIPLIIKETNTKDTRWDDILKRNIYNKPFISSDIQKLVELMVKRMKDVWKSEKVFLYLFIVIRMVIKHL